MSLNLNPWLALILGILIGWVLEWLLELWFFRGRRLECQRRLSEVEARLRTRDGELAGARAHAASLEADLTARSVAVLPAVVAVAAPAIAMQLPGVAVAVPEVKADLPEIAVAAPEVTADLPAIAVEAPAVAARLPEVALAAPAIEAELPEIIVAAPEIKAELPDVEVLAQGIEAELSETGIAAPGIATELPVFAVEMPEVKAAPPEVAIAVPEIAVELPVVSAEMPEIAVAAPGIKAELPTFAVEMPEVKAALPDIALAVPETKAELPVVAAAVPEVKAALPEIEVSALEIDAELPNIEAAARSHDDLLLIRGIGPKFASQLYVAGVTSFSALAEMTPEQLQGIIQPPAWQKVDYAEWIAEAKTRASEPHAKVSGDDLEAIEGIGSVYATKLRAAGITSFVQLAATEEARLSEIIQAQAWRRVNFSSWREQARLVAPSASVRLETLQDKKAEECPQDLSRVEGVGAVYEQKLYAAGIGTFWDLTNAADEDLKRILDIRGFQKTDLPAIKVEARRLAEKTNTMGRSWSGRLPDDFEPLGGIGEVYEGRLYDAGICTYQALAGATVEQLAAICKAPAWRAPAYADWIAQAKEMLAQRGR